MVLKPGNQRAETQRGNVLKQYNIEICNVLVQAVIQNTIDWMT